MGERIKMKRIVYVSALVMFTLACFCSGSAQTSRGGANAPVGSNVLTALPASDAVMTVDVQRLYREALPRIYASDPAKLAEINADIEEFKTRTGLDPRAFERVTVGVRVVQTPLGMIKLQSVALARGTFSAAALVAAGRIAAKGGYQEQQYKGKTIYLFNLGRQVRFLGLRWLNLAVVVLDSNTLAFGQPERVRMTIDAMSGGARVAADVVALAQRDPNAIIGMGGNVPAALKQIELPSPELSKSVASIRQFYSSFGTSVNGFQMLTVLRTDNADAAHNLSDTVEGLKLLAPLGIARMRADKAKQLQQLVDNTKVTTVGNDVQISLDVADASVATLVHMF
jgi:hypothetical protein